MISKKIKTLQKQITAKIFKFNETASDVDKIVDPDVFLSSINVGAEEKLNADVMIWKIIEQIYFNKTNLEDLIFSIEEKFADIEPSLMSHWAVLRKKRIRRYAKIACDANVVLSSFDSLFSPTIINKISQVHLL